MSTFSSLAGTRHVNIRDQTMLLVATTAHRKALGYLLAEAGRKTAPICLCLIAPSGDYYSVNSLKREGAVDILSFILGIGTISIQFIMYFKFREVRKRKDGVKYHQNIWFRVFTLPKHMLEIENEVWR